VDSHCVKEHTTSEFSSELINWSIMGKEKELTLFGGDKCVTTMTFGSHLLMHAAEAGNPQIGQLAMTVSGEESRR
jgi:hypothetical protein